MDGVFVRSLALATGSDARCITSASRTTGDGTFAVASSSEGVIRVYAASCAALLHEFSTIHARVYALHYTSFSDSLVTLESDRVAGSGSGGDEDAEDGDEETFLCVYHDWREQKMVRGYTLPLGVLDTPGSTRKADCVAVCSFTGRVVVAMGNMLNIWQCSQGFFEHVMELKVDMSQQGAYHVLESVAIHGVYVAYASSTEVRVIEVHVQSVKDMAASSTASSSSRNSSNNHARRGVEVASSLPSSEHHTRGSRHQGFAHDVPEDGPDCVHFSGKDDASAFEAISIPLASYGEIEDEDEYLQLQHLTTEPEHLPVVLDRGEAQQEAWNLAGLMQSQDLRVNQAMSYFVAEGDVKVLLQRFQPPNQRIQHLRFLPETIDNRASLEARSYTRLLVGTVNQAFLYYFLSDAADVTRKRMAKKVFGRGDMTRTKGARAPLRVARGSPTNASASGRASTSTNADSDDAKADVESGRVVMHYSFTSAVSCITANSSFLFVVTPSALQVWSIWSPCHHGAATRALSASVLAEPAQPQLIRVEPLRHPMLAVAALDSYVMLLPLGNISGLHLHPREFLCIASLNAMDDLPEDEFELRGGVDAHDRGLYLSQDGDDTGVSQPSMLILQQSPPSAIFAHYQSARGLQPQTRVDLLLSLFSLYRYRAEVGAGTLHDVEENQQVAVLRDASTTMDARELLALQLETELYDSLASQCALELAHIFLARDTRNLSHAALFFVASNSAPSEVLSVFQGLVEEEGQSHVRDVTHDYLQACLFPSSDTDRMARLPSRSQRSQRSPTTNEGFTRTVLAHYMEYVPAQLTRLVIDTSLVWTLEDLSFAHDMLSEATSLDRASMRIARLVLILRAESFIDEQWRTYQDHDPARHDALRAQCSYHALCQGVDAVLPDSPRALERLCVAHPDLLVQSAGNATAMAATSLSRALLSQAPLLLAKILQAIYHSAIANREAVLASVLFCIHAAGQEVSQVTVARISSTTPVAPIPDTQSNQDRLATGKPASFGADHCVLLRTLIAALDSFPRLQELSERDEINEDDETLFQTRRAVATELLHRAVELISQLSSSSVDDDAGASDAAALPALLLRFFSEEELLYRGESSERRDEELPAWEMEYITSRCLPASTPALRGLVRVLLTRVLVLMQDKTLIRPEVVLAHYEAIAMNSIDKPDQAETSPLGHAFATLLVLLSLPKVARTTDGLRLIAAKPDCVGLFLPYGKCYCATLDEWRFLIQTLSALGDSSDKKVQLQLQKQGAHDEVGVLESVLNHVCATLGPEDLLHVLPDDGDLALYMATIEASMRLQDGHNDRGLDALRALVPIGG